jgi:hypothetical protein
MNKLRNYLILASALLVLSWSDVSKFCRHQMIDWKFRASALKASTIAPVPDTVAYDYADDPSIIDFADTEGSTHGGEILVEELDTAFLEAAIARMDSADVPRLMTWEMLRDVKYKKRYNEAYDQYFDYPVFGEKIKAFDRQKVSVKGYIIPLDVGLYALSKNPYASCFFCGGAGPETIMGLTFAKPPKRYKTDEFLTLQGVFQLNSTDVNKFMYQLYAVEAAK